MAVKDNKDGTYDIHGKTYVGVPKRVNDFRDTFGMDMSIITDLVSDEDGIVIVKASVLNAEGRVIGTGYAEEIRGSTNVNKTSALENCETSAIGRALANVGYAGSEYASAGEVTTAVLQEAQNAALTPLLAQNSVVRECFNSVVELKNAIRVDDAGYCHQVWSELTDDEKRALWIAPSKGGIFTTEERAYLQTAKSRAEKAE